MLVGFVFSFFLQVVFLSEMFPISTASTAPWEEVSRDFLNQCYH